MRVYALLCGTLLTVGSATIAELALQSAYRAPAGAVPGSAAAPDAIWQGGAVAPITVEARLDAPVRATLSQRAAVRSSPRRHAQRAVSTAAATSAAREPALPTTTTH